MSAYKCFKCLQCLKPVRFGSPESSCEKWINCPMRVFSEEINRAKKTLNTKFDYRNLPDIVRVKDLKNPFTKEKINSFFVWDIFSEFLVDEDIEPDKLLVEVRHTLAHIFEYQIANLNPDIELEMISCEPVVDCEKHSEFFKALFKKLMVESN